MMLRGKRVRYFTHSHHLGVGKLTYTFFANANILSATFPFSVLPAGRRGVGEAEKK